MSCAAVDHTITGAHLVAVFWQDVYHSGRDPDLMEGVIWSQWAGWHKGVQEICIICLPGDLEASECGINLFLQIWRAARISVANSGRNGGPNLALVQELCRSWELGINGCSSECQKGKLWVSTAVLSTLECMLHRFHIPLQINSIVGLAWP